MLLKGRGNKPLARKLARGADYAKEERRVSKLKIFPLNSITRRDLDGHLCMPSFVYSAALRLISLKSNLARTYG